MKENNIFKGVIYQAINIQNLKSYIGKTFQDFEEYKKYHIENALKNKDNNKKYFYNAIRKYGEHNFKWIILGEIFSYNLEDLNNQLNEAEINSIWIFRTFGSDGEKRDGIYGYNMTKGGDGGDTMSQHPDKKEIYNKLRHIKKQDAIQQWANKTEIERKIIGDKISNALLSKPESEKQETVNKFLKTLENDPSIMEKATLKRLEKEKNNPEIQIQRIKTYKETLDKDPSIKEKRNKKISQRRTEKKLIVKECRALIQYFNIENIDIPDAHKGIKIWNEFHKYLYNYINIVLSQEIIDINFIINSYKIIKPKTKWELRTDEERKNIGIIYSKSRLKNIDKAIITFKATIDKRNSIIQECKKIIIIKNINNIILPKGNESIKKWIKIYDYLVSL